MTYGNCQISQQQVSNLFLAAPPFVSETIYDLSLRHPSWMGELAPIKEFPRGNGTEQQQWRIRANRPQIERNFNQWKQLNNNTGCAPCAGPDSSYNWSTIGGQGWERVVMSLMSRDYRSNPYPVHEIQTTANYKQVFDQIVKQLYEDIRWIKDINIMQTAFSLMTKKYVVDSDGPKPNPANPYSYRNIGTAELSSLNVFLLEEFYEYMRLQTDAVPYDVVNGSPVFAMECSHQLLAHLYRDDPDLRQDVRFSGAANDLLMKYNFMTTIRNMFIPAPILWPRRFDVVDGEPVEVLPVVNDVPAEYGVFSDINPAYQEAEYEEVTLHGMNPFEVYYMPTEQTLGSNTSFGPEATYFNTWEWFNNATVEDPARRVGFFFTNATIGISAQFSQGAYAILVKRPPKSLSATFFPAPTCPPVAPECDNTVPDGGCPCPLILDFQPNPVDSTVYFFTLATPTTAVAEDEIQLGLDNGNYITGTVETVSTDSLSIEVSFGTGTDLGTCDHFTTLFCDDTLGCKSDVLSASQCRSGVTDEIELYLKNPIKALTAADVIVANMGDGTQQELQVVSVDPSQNLWVVQYVAGATGVPTDGQSPKSADMLCDRNGILSVCVPTATDATCGSCDTGLTYEQCET